MFCQILFKDNSNNLFWSKQSQFIFQWNSLIKTKMKCCVKVIMASVRSNPKTKVHTVNIECGHRWHRYKPGTFASWSQLDEQRKFVECSAILALARAPATSWWSGKVIDSALELIQSMLYWRHIRWICKGERCSAQGSIRVHGCA